MIKDKLPKIKTMLQKAESELNKFKKTRKFPNLSQACEKTWVAFVLMLEFKSGKELRGGHSPVRETANDMGLESLYHVAKSLHIYHYEGDPETEFSEITEDIDYSISMIKSILKW